MSLGKSLEKHATLKPIPVMDTATIIDTGEIEKSQRVFAAYF